MIFYFTGTGNSRYLAERIASQTGDELMNISTCVQCQQYSFKLKEDERLGFVVPVYFNGIPVIILEFLKNLNISNCRYSYALLNCGNSTADAGGMFLRAYHVDALFSIKMVENYVPLFKIESEEIIQEHINRANIEMDGIIRQITNMDKGFYDEAKGIFPHITTLFTYPIYKHGRKTRDFTVNDSCIGCGLCENICPRKAMRIEKEKPVWQIPQCELCLGCLHRCPKQAIDYGSKTVKNGRYVNLQAKL